jgi:hypothetical protein
MIGELTFNFYSLIPGLSAPRSGNSRRRQLNALTAEANHKVALANRENLYGATAMGVLEKAGAADNQALNLKNLSQIAVWHFSASAEKYREAAAAFAVAAEFAALKINRKKLQAKADELRKRAEQAESAANSIQTF